MVTKYQHFSQIPDSVVSDYSFSRGISKDEAFHKCVELAKFLRACALSREAISPSVNIDDVWHEFILHTEEYIGYCHKEFGRIIHHRPMRDSASGDLRASYERARKTVIAYFGELDSSMWASSGAHTLAICGSRCGSGD